VDVQRKVRSARVKKKLNSLWKLPLLGLPYWRESLYFYCSFDGEILIGQVAIWQVSDNRLGGVV
jgi:hypothetical protein